MNAGDILLGARKILASGKWCKGQLHDKDGNSCALGAIELASEKVHEWSISRGETVAVEAVESLIDSSYQQTGDEDFRLLAQFNDDESTTLADVIALFDKALAELGRLNEVTE